MITPRSSTGLPFVVAALMMAGCRVAAPSPTTSGASQTERPPLIDTPPLAARCEPARCDTFCDSASCLFDDRRACLQACRDRCGDAYFEPADREVVTCVEAKPGCEPAKACCAQHFTSHLCGP